MQSSSTVSDYESNYDSGGGTNDLMASSSSGGYHNNGGGGRSASGTTSTKTSFFQSSNQSKYEDLKQMLESSKELLKLEAMKRIITMVAKGRSAESARELFPHVVKNVVTKNTELKKLVYLYLTRYAEQEQDLALLSIATFQHALKDPNPLIRGSAIRVLSSIRVPMISPIVLIAIKDCANDMSPYVRKTAAHAIPKLVSLDPDIKDEVIDIIAKLLADKVSLVLGSAVAAFEEVCPDRFDLIHQNYRKLCQLLVDVDEWGQILVINMLVRYARTQFLNPNGGSGASGKIDPDHMLLIRSAKPLLQSRNSGVVLAVIQLYLAVAPHFEITASLVRPLIRLLHSHYEIQLVILKNIVTLTSAEFNGQKWIQEPANAAPTPHSNGHVADDDQDEEMSDEAEEPSPAPTNSGMVRTIKSLFEPYLKSFFVKANDSTPVKILKLEILTNLSNTGNYISLVLREFQAYILNYQDDLAFMAATIESIGQCASRIKEVAPVCLNGLVSLLSNRNETIVAQSIVVIRTQIINKDDNIISMIVKQIVKLMDKISQPQARATIVWIVAEFCGRNRHARRLGPNVLLQMARSFTQEHDLVKLQALNLAAKLYITMVEPGLEQQNCEPLQIDQERLKLLINYVFNLAKYDLNYDVRDRGRFLRQLITEPDMARRVLLVPKQVPNVSQRAQMLAASNTATDCAVSPCELLASSADSSRYRFGTLSHFLGKKLSDYEELPDWPETAPDPSVRKQAEPVKPAATSGAQLEEKYRLRARNGFLSDSDEDEEEDDEEDDDEEEEVDEESDEEEDEEEYEEVDDDQEAEEDEEEEDSESEAEEEEEEEDKKPVMVAAASKKQGKRALPKQDVDLLLDLSDLTVNETSSTASTTPLHQPLLPVMQQSAAIPEPPFKMLESAESVSYRQFPLLDVPYHFKVSYRFPRINQDQRTLVEMVIQNQLPPEDERNSNRITIQAPENGSVQFKNVQCQDNVATLPRLESGESSLVAMAIDFNESPSLGIELRFERSHTVRLVAPLGEILYPVRFSSIEEFSRQQLKLTGMNQVDDKFVVPAGGSQLSPRIDQIVLGLANVCTNRHLREADSKDTALYYSACTVKFKSLILIKLELVPEDNTVTIRSTVNCEKMVLGSMMSKMLKDECLKQLQ